MSYRYEDVPFVAVGAVPVSRLVGRANMHGHSYLLGKYSLFLNRCVSSRNACSMYSLAGYHLVLVFILILRPGFLRFWEEDFVM